MAPSTRSSPASPPPAPPARRAEIPSFAEILHPVVLPSPPPALLQHVAVDVAGQSDQPPHTLPSISLVVGANSSSSPSTPRSRVRRGSNMSDGDPGTTNWDNSTPRNNTATATAAARMAAPAFSPVFYTTAASATTPSAGEASSPNFAWKPDEFTLDQGYQAFRKELRDLIFTAAQSAAPTREVSPVDSGGGGAMVLDSSSSSSGRAHQQTQHGERAQQLHQEGLWRGPQLFGMMNSQAEIGSDPQQIRRETAQILATGNKILFLRNYISEVAPWLDMFDSDRAFGLQLPALARTAPALLYAILGISARQMERKENKKNAFESLELYQEAIRLLAPLLLDRDLIIIPICVILCCLEMMSVSAQDWRRHLEGCAALFNNFGVNGFSGGLLQAVFWCYARMDLCGALISDGLESTLVPPSKWLPPGSEIRNARQLFSSCQHPDMYANYSVWLTSRVCELVSDRTRFRELGEQNGCTGDVFAERWVALWQELQTWIVDSPPEFHAVRTVETKPFPQTLFPHWAAISSTQLHHTSCLLLLGIMPKPLDPSLTPGSIGSVVWHAKKICGISLANSHQGCLNNAIQPIWLAGRHLSHRSEHDLIVKLIWSIESLTGWGTCWRISDLEAAWGYKVRRM
ncbi:fungal specific transcription factor domain-containing protein [Microdochium nivale]|nr:fungal specific transcription factor domain-containing protein [Microdochium nivale]